MRLRPAAVQAASARSACLPDITETPRTLRWRGRPWRSQASARIVRRLSAIGGRRWGAGVALGLHDVDAGRDAVVIKHVGPLESVELGTAESGVEGDRVGEAVFGLERGEQRSSLGHASAWAGTLSAIGSGIAVCIM
jgi:hypothetical protein